MLVIGNQSICDFPGALLPAMLGGDLQKLQSAILVLLLITYTSKRQNILYAEIFAEKGCKSVCKFLRQELVNSENEDTFMKRGHFC